MIYCLYPNDYPNDSRIIEEIIYNDENEMEWRIARTENGFYVKYFGIDYFKETYFSCDLSNGQHILINNTNCIFISDKEFETFALVRDTLKAGYTDEIWDTFREMFEERFEHDKSILDSEVVKFFV